MMRAVLISLIRVVVASPFQCVRASDLDSYDLDSVVFMSEQIVRGTFVPGKGLVVSASYFGSCKPNDSLLVGELRDYCKPSGLSAGQEVGNGDEVIAFLSHPKPNFHNDIPTSAYFPVPSGLKMIVDGKVCGFRQQMNPGPYVMVGPDAKPACPTVQDFEKQCGDAIKRVRPIADRLARPAAKQDLPWLLEVLRSRPHPDFDPFMDHDAIAETICAKLAELKDVPALDEALRLTKISFASTALVHGFAFAEGREYLLQKLTDPQLPDGVARRELYAYAINDGIWDYARSAETGQRFLERLAKASVEIAKKHEDLATTSLLSHLKTAASLHEQDKKQGVKLPSALEPDLTAALNVLKSDYDQGDSPRARFEIDCIMITADPDLGFKSPVGPVTTLITFPEPERHYAKYARNLTYEYSYFSSSEARDRRFAVAMILEDTKANRSFVIPMQGPIKGGQSGGGGDLAPLPKDLPESEYRVFYRLSENGKAVSDGHRVVVKLPSAVD